MNRRTLADEIDKLDEQIAELQREKSEFYASYRASLETKGEHKDKIKLELAAVKVAIRHRQKLAKDRDAVEEKDDLAAAILDEITGTPVATRTRATREAIQPAPPEPERPAPIRTLPATATLTVTADDGLAIPDYLRRQRATTTA